MQKLNFYNTLLDQIKDTDPDAAEHLTEEINILVHKLKFIPQDQRPSVLILTQKTGFQPLFNDQLVDSVAIAGGKLLSEKYDNPTFLLIVQEDDELYTNVPHLLQDEILSRTDATQSNNIYVIHKSNFGTLSADFLLDIEICAEILQPKYFVYGRKGMDWVQFDIA